MRIGGLSTRTHNLGEALRIRPVSEQHPSGACVATCHDSVAVADSQRHQANGIEGQLGLLAEKISNNVNGQISLAIVCTSNFFAKADRMVATSVS